MKIRLKDLALNKVSVIHVDEQVDLKERVSNHSDLLNIEPVHVKVNAVYGSGVYEVKGHLETIVTLKCSRCLNTYEMELSVPFRELFAEREGLVSSEEEEDLHIVHENEVDLLPYVEEAIHLAIPFIPVCREDCKGLCPVCGVDRNTVRCECKQEKIDPRLAGLADLFKKDE